MKGREIKGREVILAATLVTLGAITVRITGGRVRQGKMMSRQCAANLKQLGLAMAQYAQDYDGTLPRPWFGRGPGPSDARLNSKWMDAVFPYAKNSQIFACPADAQSKPYRFRDGDNYGSYLFNDAYFAPGDALTPPGGRKLASIASFQTALVMCGGRGFRFAWPDAKSAPALEADRIGGIQLRHWRANDGPSPTTLWIDGSVHDYSAAQVLWARKIGGQSIYTGLTIENDGAQGTP